MGIGRVTRVNGPLIEIDGLSSVAMAELVALGRHQLPGEVVAIRDGSLTVQAYETTSGLVVGDPAVALGQPLSARLGPDLLGGVFDGLLRPLGDAPTWLAPRPAHPATDTVTTWSWQPTVAEHDPVTEGTVLGILPEVQGVEYRVLVPPGARGPVEGLAPAGRYAGDDVLATVAGTEVSLTQEWPVRRPRPVRERLDTVDPLLTGQRVLDALFPLARGGSASVPGGFGTGKTMLLQQVAKWCTADVIVYVGCGERGNEMADVLAQLGTLVDPHTQRPLAERTVIIANTSNMPMMARESSIHTGVTVAEYFRDMGHDTVVIADSTSRWAEALREFGSRSGALPAEEGYPASLGSAISSFYERAARVTTLGGTTGSVTIIGAVSPPGGDTTEPVTTLTQRAVRSVWNLQRDLAYARHYPAVGWVGSFSRDSEKLARWCAEHGDLAWPRRRARLAGLLAEADRLGDLAELVGASSLPARERVALLAGRLLREGVLQQSALSPNDVYCAQDKTAALIDAVIAVVDRCGLLVEQDVPVGSLEEFDFGPLLRCAAETAPDDAAGVAERSRAVLDDLGSLT